MSLTQLISFYQLKHNGTAHDQRTHTGRSSKGRVNINGVGVDNLQQGSIVKYLDGKTELLGTVVNVIPDSDSLYGKIVRVMQGVEEDTNFSDIKEVPDWRIIELVKR